jgi:hypothetical protein
VDPKLSTDRCREVGATNPRETSTCRALASYGGDSQPCRIRRGISACETPPVAAGADGGRDPETLRVYWLAQWDRVARLEDQRLQFSNFVVAGSVVAIGLNATSATSISTAVVVAAMVATTNLIAWLYNWRSDRWLRMHHRRANLLIEENWAYIDHLKDRAGRPTGRRPLHGHTAHMHRALHLVLMVSAIGLTVATVMGA